MSESNDQLQNFAAWRSFFAHEERRRSKRREELRSLIWVVPVAAEVLGEVIWLGPGDRESVLQHHPGHEVERKLQSLWQMLAVFERAHADIVAQLDAFDAFSLTDAMHLPSGKVQLAGIETALNKELVAFSAAAGALVSFSRRLRGEDGLPVMQPQIVAMFDAAEHSFVIALRNVICHEEFPDVGWQIKHDRTTGRSTDFVLSRRSLDQLAGLPADAQAYLASSPEGVGVRSLVDCYARRVRALYAWYQQACAASVPLHLQDYRRVVMACKANGSRTMHRVLLSQFLARGVDPYQYLHRYLLPHQVEEALKLPTDRRRRLTSSFGRPMNSMHATTS